MFPYDQSQPVPKMFYFMDGITPDKKEKEIIAIDGKTMRHRADTVMGRKAVHIVSAWAD